MEKVDLSQLLCIAETMFQDLRYLCFTLGMFFSFLYFFFGFYLFYILHLYTLLSNKLHP